MHCLLALLLLASTAVAGDYETGPFDLTTGTIDATADAEMTEWYIPGEYHAILKDNTHPNEYSLHIRQTELHLRSDNRLRDESRKGQGLPPAAEEDRYRILDIRSDGYLFKASDDRSQQINKEFFNVDWTSPNYKYQLNSWEVPAEEVIPDDESHASNDTFLWPSRGESDKVERGVDPNVNDKNADFEDIKEIEPLDTDVCLDDQGMYQSCDKGGVPYPGVGDFFPDGDRGRKSKVRPHQTELPYTYTMVQKNTTWNLAAISHLTPIKAAGVGDVFDYLYEAPYGREAFVYVLDSGIRADHEEFRKPDGTSRVEKVFDATNGRFGEFDLDHGTHVAGIVGGLKYGVAKNTTLVDVRIAGKDGLDSGSVASGLRWAIEDILSHERRWMRSVIHLGVETGAKDHVVMNMIKEAHKKRITVVVSSGNLGWTMYNTYPAAMKEPTTVSAFDSSYTRMRAANAMAKVDIFAPGVDIKAASARAANAYSFRTGTSAAAAHVSGYIAYRFDIYGEGDQKAVWQGIREQSVKGQIVYNRAAPDRYLFNGNDLEALKKTLLLG